MGIQVSYQAQDLIKACENKHAIKIKSDIPKPFFVFSTNSLFSALVSIMFHPF